MALTVRWMLVTGRRLGAADGDGRPLLHDLPCTELLDFWADDQLS